MVLVSFVSGPDGDWRITRVNAVAGEPLPIAAALSVREGAAAAAAAAAALGPAQGRAWALAGVTSNLRYTSRAELLGLAAASEGLGRPAASRAALIPIKKSDAWWSLAQDERVAILARSRHIQIGMASLPQVARRLHHCRDLGMAPGGEAPPFDFLTWFEYAPGDEALFEGMVAQLRATEEWKYVEREVDIRLERAAA